MKKITLTCAHAIVKYLIAQKILINGKKEPLFPGVFGIFGHGNVTCLAEALEQVKDTLPTWRGQNEQSMALAGIAYSKSKLRQQIMIATSSIGPGATNMLTASALAHANRLPLLILSGDVFANRRPDPVLQQLEHFNNPTITANDAFKAVTRYWDRISHPEQIIHSLPQATAIMLDPSDCGPAFIGLCQDTQEIAYDYPIEFFEPKIHSIPRPRADKKYIEEAINHIKSSKKPLIIAGGGVRYSRANEVLRNFATKLNVPVSETIAGKGTLTHDDPINIGPIGVVGSTSANYAAKNADLVIAVGTRLQDFTTGSWTNFENENFQLVSINTSRFDTTKHRATPVVSDAKIGLQELSKALGEWKAPDNWYQRSIEERNKWDEYVAKESGPTNQELPSYAHAVGAVYRNSDPSDIVVTAAGGLVGEVVQIWKPKELNTFETEWGFSCMSYEISGALGIKMAKPDQDVVVFVGDGSYLLQNSDIYSSVLYDKKLIIVVCDNGGHMVINRLQLAKGGKEYLCNLRSARTSNLEFVDFEAHAKSMGANAETVKTTSELESAFKRAKESDKTYVISMLTHGYEWLDGTAFWESPTLEVDNTEGKKSALNEFLEGKNKQRKGV